MRTKDNDLISVIIPVYNAEKTIKKCADSLLNQTYPNLEIIIVDDGSVDRSGLICDSFASLPSVTVVHQKNCGVSAARNKGLELAKGTYIGFCDNDDYVHPDYYEKLHEGLIRTGSQIAVSGYCQEKESSVQREEQPEMTSDAFRVLEPEAAFGCLVRGEYPLKSYLWNKLYQADLFSDLRFPEGKVIEDQFVMYKLFLKAEKICVTDWKGYYYNWSPSSATNRKWNRKDLDYLDAWKKIEAFCTEYYPEYAQDARDQVVSAAVYSYSRMRKSGERDKQTAQLLLNDILQYSDHYFKSTLETANVKRKILVSLLRIRRHFPRPAKRDQGMIYVEMNGRMGNQMFRYAFARWLQTRAKFADEELVVDFSPVLQEKKKEQMPGWDDSLQHFHVIPYAKYQKEGRIIVNETSFSEKMILGFIKAADKVIGDKPLKRIAIRKPFLPVLNRHGIYQMFTGYDYSYEWVSGRKLVCGPFECARYCEEIRDLLLEEFVPNYPLREENNNLMQRIQNSNSVCITVRRGNYLDYPALNVCTKAYFEQAARRMRDLVEQPLFIVFSDDVEWTKENLEIPGEVLYESGSDPVWEKMRLMYSCKHFIISNSTFSWWAQFLGQYPEKIVIAPDHWFNSEYQPPLYEDGWILQSVQEEHSV